MNPDDKDLVRRINLGDESAMEALIDKYDHVLRPVATGMFCISLSPANAYFEAEDALQDAYLALWETRAAGVKDSLCGFMRGVVANKVCDRFRKRAFVPFDENYVDDRIDLEADAYAREVSNLVQEQILLMPTPDQQLLNLYIKGFSLKEISKILGMSPARAKWKLHAAKKKLSKHIKDKLFNPPQT